MPMPTPSAILSDLFKVLEFEEFDLDVVKGLTLELEDKPEEEALGMVGRPDIGVDCEVEVGFTNYKHVVRG
jgi:hypothetical protein